MQQSQPGGDPGPNQAPVGGAEKQEPRGGDGPLAGGAPNHDTLVKKSAGDPPSLNSVQTTENSVPQGIHRVNTANWVAAWGSIHNSWELYFLGFSQEGGGGNLSISYLAIIGSFFNNDNFEGMFKGVFNNWHVLVRIISKWVMQYLTQPVKSGDDHVISVAVMDTVLHSIGRVRRRGSCQLGTTEWKHWEFVALVLKISDCTPVLTVGGVVLRRISAPCKDERMSMTCLDCVFW